MVSLDKISKLAASVSVVAASFAINIHYFPDLGQIKKATPEKPGTDATLPKLPKDVNNGEIEKLNQDLIDADKINENELTNHSLPPLANSEAVYGPQSPFTEGNNYLNSNDPSAESVSEDSPSEQHNDSELDASEQATVSNFDNIIDERVRPQGGKYVSIPPIPMDAIGIRPGNDGRVIAVDPAKSVSGNKN